MFLSVIIPCYNEESVIQETNRRVSKLLGSLITQNLITKYEIIYINDGSIDATYILRPVAKF